MRGWSWRKSLDRHGRRFEIVGVESFAVYRFPDRDNPIIVVGENHVAANDDRGGCISSVRSGARTVSEFVNDVLQTRPVVDVFAEIPVVPVAFFKKRRNGFGDRVGRLVRRLLRWLKCVTFGAEAEDERRIDVDESDHDTQLFRRFGHRFDFARSPDRGGTHRFHAIDIRWDPHVMCILVMPSSTYAQERKAFAWLAAFMKLVPSVSSFTSLIRCFLMSEDFPRDLARVVGEERARFFIVPDALAEGNRHPIAHQLGKVSRRMRKTILAHVDHRISEIEKTLRDDVEYDMLARTFGNDETCTASASSTTAEYEASLKEDIRRVRCAAMMSSLEIVVRMWVPVLLMDVYGACRTMRYSREVQPSSVDATCVVVVGQVHAEHMARFLCHEANAVQEQYRRSPSLGAPMTVELP